jgi:hypothetical protein
MLAVNPVVVMLPEIVQIYGALPLGPRTVATTTGTDVKVVGNVTDVVKDEPVVAGPVKLFEPVITVAPAPATISSRASSTLFANAEKCVSSGAIFSLDVGYTIPRVVDAITLLYLT